MYQHDNTGEPFGSPMRLLGSNESGNYLAAFQASI